MKIVLYFILTLTCLSYARMISIPIGGSLENGSPILNMFAGKKVAFFTSADPTPERTGPETEKFFTRRGIQNTWVKVYEPCVDKVRNPEFIKQVEDADVIYFTGGYSDKLSSCLFGDNQSGTITPLLAAIQKKQIVAGSSAGAMVQPMANMLLTRNPVDSYQAIVRRQVPFSPHAFKLFNRGLVDVHFSERGRQGRLFVFAWQTRTRWAFGVDENTAIIEYPDGNIKVAGQNGVVIFDMLNNNMKNGTMHFLTEGDILTKSGDILYPAWKSPCPPLSNLPPPSTNIFNQFRSISLNYAKYSGRESYRGVYGRSPIVEVVFDKRPNTRSMCGKFNNTQFESFSNMQVLMGVTSKVDLIGDEYFNKESQYIDL